MRKSTINSAPRIAIISETSVKIGPRLDPILPHDATKVYESFSASTWDESIGSSSSMSDDEVEQCKNTPKTEYFGSMTTEQLSVIVTCIWMSIAAIFASLIRILIAQSFGDDCEDPGTLGWLASGSPLCVKAGGETDQQDGIVFAELPANMLGSFIMGMMQTTTTLGLPVDAAIAWAASDSFFQHWDTLHLVIRTGICSSITTYSSWNSQMVIIIYGTGVTHSSNVTRAMFGYFIGMETALGSYILGKKVAIWIHRWRNPLNALEMDAILDRKEIGVYINRSLPEFERRFLPGLVMDMGADSLDSDRLLFLYRWRDSTIESRRVKHPQLELLIEMETAMLVERRVFAPHRAGAKARKLNWDVDALEKWCKGMAPVKQDKHKDDHVLFTPEYSTCILLVVCCVLLSSVFFVMQSVSPFAITYRTMMYATLFAPPGALIRWYISGFNGTLKGKWAWLPVGTMAVNVLGSVISIALIASEYMTNKNGIWRTAFLRAFKVGFISSFTTVSVLVCEVDGFLRNRRKQQRAYIYMALTLGSSCILSVMMYGAVILFWRY